MSVIAPVEDGKIVETDSQNSLAKKSGIDNSSMNKDTFLQLLVAQMKYQDPLEPTSNTEYISQYAQFSQVEQMQNMSGSMDLQRASNLVGKEVYMKTTNSKGETKLIQGRVDSVVYQSGKAYLQINENLYKLEDLDAVADKDYLEAYYLATDFVNSLNKLPNVHGVDFSDMEEIERLEALYGEMTDYQKSFVAKEKVKALEAYVAKLEELKLASEDYKSAQSFTEELGKLPKLEEITLEHGETIDKLEKSYNDMNDNAKRFVNKEQLDSLLNYVKKLKELRQEEGSGTEGEGN